MVKGTFTVQPAIHISPNPASGFINVSLENLSEAAKMQIIDVSRKMVKQQLVTRGTPTELISLAGMAKGLYIVKLVSAGDTTAQKLVIQ